MNRISAQTLIKAAIVVAGLLFGVHYVTPSIGMTVDTNTAQVALAAIFASIVLGIVTYVDSHSGGWIGEGQLGAIPGAVFGGYVASVALLAILYGAGLTAVHLTVPAIFLVPVVGAVFLYVFYCVVFYPISKLVDLN